MLRNDSKFMVRVGAAGLILCLAGCATVADGNSIDPYESFNRRMYSFNEGMDKAVLKPVAIAYTTVTPQPVRTGVSNFFANIGDFWSLINSLLQGEGEDAYETMVRVNLNTVFGLGGVIDIASNAGIARHKQDFGLTLSHWGIKSGPYLVLPLLGPSTVRDASSLPIDIWGNAMGRIEDVTVRNSLYSLNAVSGRASLLGADNILESVAFDKYSFLRDAYMQIRSQQEDKLTKGNRILNDDSGKLLEDY